MGLDPKPTLDYIARLKEFGSSQLHLQFDGSFCELAADSFSCNWVYACPVDSLQSVFKGQRPFEFYADEARGRARCAELSNEGYEIYFYHAEAHGGGNCPITRELIEAGPARIGYVVLHEAWHTTCKVNRYNLPYAVEESTGRVIGLFGAIRYGQFAADAQLTQLTTDQETAWYGFATFINAAWDELQRLYSTAAAIQEIASCKEQLAANACQLQHTLPASWEKQELLQPINNAFIARYHDYTVHYPWARALLMQCRGDLAAAMKRFSQELPPQYRQ